MKFSFYLLLQVLLFAGICLGQSASITGTIKDASQSAVPDATVKIVNLDQGWTRSTASNQQGLYTFSSLRAGKYEIHVDKQGFRPLIRENIVLDVDQQASIDLELEVGSSKQAVTVESGRELLETHSAAVGTVITNTFIKEIPLNGRDFSQLIALAPGASNSNSGGQTSYSYGSGYSIGGRDNQNNFMFDGGADNARQYGNIAVKPSIDAIEEFKIQSNSYSAEYGQAGMAQINLISKSGTNQFHGVAFEFLRNNDLDARNFFLPTVPKLNRNQFGGSLGGPIRKDRTFFFINYEGSRELRGETGTRSVPPLAWRTGDFSSLLSGSKPVQLKDPTTGYPIPGNLISPTSFSKPAVVALSMWPAPNFGTSATNNLTITKPDSNNADQGTVHIDQIVSDTNHLSGRYSAYKLQQVSTPSLPGFELVIPPLNISAVLSDTQVFSPNVLAEFHASFTRSKFQTASLSNDKPGFYEQFGINNPLISSLLEGAPEFDFSGISLTTFGDPFSMPNDDISNEYMYSGNLTWIHGQHTIKAGASLTFYQQNTPIVPTYQRGDFSFTGTFTGNAFADMLYGYPYQSTRTVGTGVETGRSRWQGGFIQDDWKVSPKLTLNFGLRYDYITPLVDVRDRRSVFYPLTNDYNTGLPGQIIQANSQEAKSLLGLSGVGLRALYKPDRNDFAPRFGFAYNIAPRTVIRGAYGIFFVNSMNLVNDFVIVRRQPPSAESQVVISPSATTPTVTLTDPFATATQQANLATQNVDPNFRDGYVQQWNFSIQHQLTKDTILDLGYLANKGTKLSALYYNNVPTPGSFSTIQARRPFPDWGTALTLGSFVNSSYNSFQAKLQKRFNHGLTFIASYTWSKSIDDSSERGGGDSPQDGGNQRDLSGYFRGPSGFDTPQRFVLSYVFDLPFGRGRRFGSSWNRAVDAILGGWELTGIVSAQTGYPFTVYYSTDQNGDGLTADRPNAVAAPLINSGNPSCYIQDSRNSACGTTFTAFGAASALGFGNEGRNVLRGPGQRQWDLGAMKTFSLTERFQLQFRSEFFNALNNVNFGMPARNYDVSTFGQITSAGDSREIQFGLKLAF